MTPLVRLTAIALVGGILVAGTLAVLMWKSPPADKLADAQRAVNEARAAGAQTLMSEDFAKLEALLTQAKAEIDEQNGKLGFLRSYARANDMLDAVLTEAARLTAEAGKRQEELKTVAVQAQRGARETVMLAQDLLDEAPGGKERTTLAVIKAEVQKLNASLSEVNASIDSANYQAAEAKANEIRLKADGVVAELRRAIDKAKAGTVR